MWFFVYILKNEQGNQYVGYTADLNQRLKAHNKGEVAATKNKRPWHIDWFCAFRDEKKAIELEKHLKTGSGTAFRYKHFSSKE